LLGVAVSLLAIYFIGKQVNVARFGEAWANAQYVYVLPCVGFLLMGLLTRAIRWRVLLSNGLPFSRTFSIMNVAYLVNGVLPLRIGEVARMYLAAQADPPLPVLKTASTIIVERLLDLLAVVVLMAFALVTGSVPDELRAVGLVTAPLALIGFLVLVFMARNRILSQKLLTFLVGRLPFLQRLNLARWLDNFLDGLQPITQPKSLIQAVLWTAVSWGFSLVAGYILMFTFYPLADWGTTALYVAAAAFAIAVPAMPLNIGPYEGSIVLALTAAGYGESFDTAAAFAVLVHGINVIVHSATGIVGFIQEGISLEQLSQGVRNIQQSAN
jgi:uncharacterized protein (TIRG00374 family)